MPIEVITGNKTTVKSESNCPRCHNKDGGVYTWQLQRQPPERDVMNAEIKGETLKNIDVAVFSCSECQGMWMEAWGGDGTGELFGENW
jgi:hypothetical protein